MDRDKEQLDRDALLRRRAEERAAQSSADGCDTISTDEMRHLIHELQVNKIELEMQNDNLRLMQENLQKSQEKYFDLFDLAPVGYLTLNEKGIIVNANLSAAALLGRPKSYLVGRPLSGFLLPDEKDLFRKCYVQLVRTLEDQVCEGRTAAEDGAVKWLRIDLSIRHVVIGLAEVKAVLADITEQKKALDTIAEKEQRYRELVENIAEGVWAVDGANSTVFVNPRMAKILGYNVNDMLGRNFFSFVDESGLAIAASYVHWQNKMNGRRQRIDFRKSDGTMVHTAVSVSVHTDDRGVYDGAVVCVQDISDRVKMEQKVLQIGMDERHRIGRDLHDDLGQQLTGMAFMTKVLALKLAEKGSSEADKAETLLTLINEAIDKTRTIAQGLLLAEHGGDNLIAGLKMLAAKTEMIYGISCSVNADDAVSICDSVQANQLYYISMEAVHNAVRHGKPESIEISLSVGGGKGVLSIKDDGEGYQEKISDKRGAGIEIMTYRAGMINAWLSITGAPSGGTEVKCIFSESSLTKTAVPADGAVAKSVFNGNRAADRAGDLQ